MNSYYREKILERFKGNYKITEGNCHIWLGGKTTQGYGKTYIFKCLFRVHTLSALLFNDLEIWTPVYVRHTCVNRLCFNPQHLETKIRVRQFKNTQC